MKGPKGSTNYDRIGKIYATAHGQRQNSSQRPPSQNLRQSRNAKWKKHSSQDILLLMSNQSFGSRNNLQVGHQTMNAQANSSGSKRESRANSTNDAMDEPYLTNLTLKTRPFAPDEDSMSQLSASDSARIAHAFRPHQSFGSTPSSGKKKTEKTEKTPGKDKDNIYLIDFMQSQGSFKSSQPSLEAFIKAGQTQTFKPQHRNSTELTQ